MDLQRRQFQQQQQLKQLTAHSQIRQTPDTTEEAEKYALLYTYVQIYACIYTFQ